MLPVCKLYILTNHPLCAQAESLLQEWVDEHGLYVELVDIAEQPPLAAELGGGVPLLERQDSGTQMAWPFDAEALAHFLK